jgi:hypothetical protein
MADNVDVRYYLSPATFSLHVFIGNPCNCANNLFDVCRSPVEAPHREEYPDKVSEDYPQHVAVEVPMSGGGHRIRDMKPIKFWALIAVCAILIIGASVGGAVGGVAAIQESPTMTVTIT